MPYCVNFLLSVLIYVYNLKDDVALKCFINLYINGKLMEIELKDLAMRYSDMRSEVNKLSTVNHPNIVQFLGLCVVSFSILLEWAPKGNLEHVINEHRIADTWICPDAVAATVHQVCFINHMYCIHMYNYHVNLY